MCDICVMNKVKERMLSRRNFFKGGAAVAAGAAAGGGLVAPKQAFAQAPRTVMDMTHELSEEFPTFGGVPGISYDKQFDFAENGYNLYVLTVNEHTGTHIDAPLHFSADGQSVAEIPVENLACPLCVIDIRARAAEDRDTQVTPDDLTAWISEHGEIPDGACVAMNSGWADKVGTDDFRGADAARGGSLHFPGFHIEATQMLLEETNAACIAVDTLSLDHGPSADFATHYAWLPAGRYGIECLAGLDAMPASGGTLMVGAPKVRGGTGGPARIMGLA
ncbi:cyclase family protein [Roseibacterium elongatum DSM 19469]|uniref:Cyclase family protein n=1 Tax=Roseicyclus elongatus DSM 19469 TaxID=1294273 RepID=W8RUD9_9RHOB|nr:cyclase family protein [Roseibacterium elongatum]AHM04829.1 cyclase family protein [Roseibacterium elongatum DSM 19469]